MKKKGSTSGAIIALFAIAMIPYIIYDWRQNSLDNPIYKTYEYTIQSLSIDDEYEYHIVAYNSDLGFLGSKNNEFYQYQLLVVFDSSIEKPKFSTTKISRYKDHWKTFNHLLLLPMDYKIEYIPDSFF